MPTVAFLKSLLLVVIGTLLLHNCAAQEKHGKHHDRSVKDADSLPAPPATRQDNVRDIMHGVEIVDPYRWLEDQQSAETRTWIDEQNAYTMSLLAKQPALSSIRRRLVQLMRRVYTSIPLHRGNYYYFLKLGADQDLPVIYRRKGLAGKDEVLLDPHTLSSDLTTSANLLTVSRDGRLLVYAVRRGGTDEAEIRVLDTASKTDLPDVLPTGLYNSVSLTSDATGFYYTKRNRQTGSRVMFHRLGTPLAEDIELFGQGYGPSVWLSATVSEDGRYLLLHAGHGWSRDELFVKELSTDGPIRPVVTDTEAHFKADFAGDTLVVHTNWQAPRYRLMRVDLADPAPSKWREIVAEREDVLKGFALIGGKVFGTYLHNVVTHIESFDLDGKRLATVKLPGLGSAFMAGDIDKSEAFIGFTSFTTPFTIYRYDTTSGQRELWSRVDLPLDSQQLDVKQVWYTSKDGTRVPMFLIHRKDIKPDGNRPVLLYGYGGFNVAITPAFRPAAALWAEHGGVYAVANIRGGSEFGEAWHRAGMLEKKQNVFDDFIAAAEWLIANTYTTPRRLAIQGVSNGGLLVGAVITQRPELYQAALCEFPDLDMIRYYQFKNNNPPALLEYGNASNPEHFKFLYAYSPYQRVVPGTKYPAVMLTTGDADTRVPPLQARKMTARLQAASTSGRPVLLLYDTQAGHAGGRPLTKVVEDTSLELAFLFWQLGIDADAQTRSRLPHSGESSGAAPRSSVR